MALNPYSLCPCGSGKKIKFCCGDLAGEMEKVLRMVEGDQPTAAVRHLDQLLKKNPGRASLLDLKSNIELQQGWHDQAGQTIEEFIAADPQNSNPWARRAILMGLQHRQAEGVDALQTAIRLSDEPPYPPLVLTAIRILGQSFAVSGQVIPAIGQFLLYSEVSEPHDMEGERELIRMTRELPIPELLKGPFRLYGSPVDSKLTSGFEAAFLAAELGRWREAAEQFEALSRRADGDAAAIYNAALLRGFLGDTARLCQGLRDFASRAATEDDAVEAIALAQALDPGDVTDGFELKELVFEVDDLDPLIERADRDRHTPRIQEADDIFSGQGEGPPPQASYYVLDREDPLNWDGIALADAPRLLASVELFGRETDRPPRAVVRTTQDDQYESKLNAVRQRFSLGDAAPSGELDGLRVTALGNFLMYHKYVPSTAPVATQVSLYEESRRAATLDVWPSSPQQILGGKTPAELAGDPGQRRELYAAVLRMLELQVPRRLRQAASAIWERLGIEPLSTSLDPDGIPHERLWFIRARRVDATRLSDERLAKLTLDAALANATQTLAHVAPEVLRRSQMHRIVNVYSISRAAVEEAADFPAAADFLNDARQLVAEEIVPAGLWNVMEFEAAFDRLEQARLADLFRKALAGIHQNEVVGKALVQALGNRGLITQDGRLRMPAPPSESETPIDRADEEEPPKIWTPQSEPARQGQGKIWMPS